MIQDAGLATGLIAIVYIILKEGIPLIKKLTPSSNNNNNNSKVTLAKLEQKICDHCNNQADWVIGINKRFEKLEDRILELERRR